MKAQTDYSQINGLMSLFHEVEFAPATLKGCTLKGKVTAAGTGHRVFGAVVELVGSGMAYVTSPSGYFKMGGIPEGIYLLRVSLPGFQPIEDIVALTDNEEVDLNLAIELE